MGLKEIAKVNLDTAYGVALDHPESTCSHSEFVDFASFDGYPFSLDLINHLPIE